MRTTLLLLAFLAGPALAGQTVWKWVDSDGVTHYADRPVPGATRMELSTGSSLPSANTPSYGSSSSSSTPADSGPAYRNFEIWKPSPEETIANTGGQVTVNIRTEPGLAPGHTLNLYLDGRLVEGFPGNTTSFDLTGVARGEHTVIATVTDSGGNRIQETERVVFYVRQESAAQPPTGPALRPPPKPQPRAGNKMPASQPTYAALNPAVSAAKIDPATNRPVVQKPAVKPSTPKPGK
ncbi:MAG TPA: DUF4124 domain-containing protein [Povalibacter sp.]|uniref:DUF4124 domain-containing protein n=1 Tax=Povalibacter sp. TaxID=1962978 RepID=UPI002CBFCE9D|nr:DUF4124 domain-containing protein [Povalibacter sp.]HMN44739.1 DUF4124 domain-containing protein [Povalibacter sp.]